MDKELNNLKDEVKYLKERVNVLEKKERNRKTFRLLGIIFKIIFYGAILFGLWWGYNYVVHIPAMLEEKVKEVNPLNNIDLSNFSIGNLFGKKESEE